MNYTNLTYTIDYEPYNVTNDSIIFNSLYMNYQLDVKYYGMPIFNAASAFNTSFNIPNVVRFSFTKCLSERINIILGAFNASYFCSESV